MKTGSPQEIFSSPAPHLVAILLLPAATANWVPRTEAEGKIGKQQKERKARASFAHRGQRRSCCFFGMSCVLSCPLTRSFCCSSGMSFKISSYMVAIEKGLCDITVCPKPWYRPTGESGFEETEAISCEEEHSRLLCSL